jgi:hypothetical protein
MKVKTSELIGLTLDWLVAKCEGRDKETRDLLTWKCTAHPSGMYSYSTNWAYGGPIIERLMKQGMLVEGVDADMYKTLPLFKATFTKWETYYRGDTPLIAAMRCYVASKLGNEVEIPGELL